MIKYSKAHLTLTSEGGLFEGGVKVAEGTSPGLSFISTLKPDPRYLYTLSNAMGYSEFFGANANADYYGYNPNIDFNGLLHAPSGFGHDPDRDKKTAKGWAFGYPCFYNASVYAHHKNTCPKTLGFGDVVYVGLHASMKRVELVQRIDKEDAIKKGHGSLLDKIRRGGRCDVSMGTRVLFDLCSICSDWDTINKAIAHTAHMHRTPMHAVLDWHKNISPIRGLAVTTQEYCQCMRSCKGKTLPSGEEVFVYNDSPNFFDISYVWVGADRTARVMASVLDTIGTVKVEAGIHPQNHTSTPIAQLKVASVTTGLQSAMTEGHEKVAEMEKVIPGGIIEAVQDDADACPDLPMESLLNVTDEEVVPMATSLCEQGVVLKPREFAALVLPPKDLPLINKMYRERASFTLDAPPGEFPEFVTGSDHALGDYLLSRRSCLAPHLLPRLKGLTPSKYPVVTDEVRSPTLDSLARMYAAYRMRVLRHMSQFLGRDHSLFSPETAAHYLTAFVHGVRRKPGTLVLRVVRQPSPMGLGLAESLIRERITSLP